MAENDTGVLTFPLDEGDQVLGSLAVISPAGFLQFLGEGGARRFECVGHTSDGVVLLSLPGLSQAEGGLSGRSGVLGFDHATESSASSKFSRDFCVHRPAGLYDIVQNAVDRVFIKDAKVSVCVEIHFQRLQL